MNKSFLILILAAALSACSDLGVSPTEQSPPPRYYLDDYILIGEIPGIGTSLTLSDSAGTVKTAFDSVEPVFMRYSVRNETGKDQTWETGMSHPFARFFVILGLDTLADSFAGKAFLAIPSEGTLKAGDSLVASWKFDPAKIPLGSGAYLAAASPQFLLVGLGVPGVSWKVLDIRP